MIRKSNGRVTHDLVVRVHVPTGVPLVEAVCAWATAAAHEACGVPVAAVAGAIADDVATVCILVAIHSTTAQKDLVRHSTLDVDGLVVVAEVARPPPKLSAASVLAHLPPWPAVLAVGVSAVSEHYCAEVWHEAVTPCRTWMAGAGLGHGKHLELRHAGGSAWTSRESSCTFGW